MAKTLNPKPVRAKANDQYRPNVFGMIQNIAIAAMNKGQFPFACVAGIVGLIIYKMPSEDVSKLAFKILTIYEITHLLGWVLTFLLVGTFYISFKRMRRTHIEELDRVSKEKDALQQVLINR